MTYDRKYLKLNKQWRIMDEQYSVYNDDAEPK